MKRIIAIEILLILMVVICCSIGCTSALCEENSNSGEVWNLEKPIEKNNVSEAVVAEKEFAVNIGLEHELINEIPRNALLNEVINSIKAPIYQTHNRNVLLTDDNYYYWKGSELIKRNKNTNDEVSINKGDIDDVFMPELNLYNYNDNLYIATYVDDTGCSELLYDFNARQLYKPFIDAYQSSGLQQIKFVNGIPDRDDRYYIFFKDIQIDTCIIGGIGDFQSPNKNYFTYDFSTNRIYDLPQFKYDLIRDQCSYNDDYLFITNSDSAYAFFSESKPAHMYILNRDTYDCVVDFELTAIYSHSLILFRIDEGRMYFYCPKESQIIEYNTSLGTINKTTEFEHDSYYIDYDIEENCLYLRLNIGFSNKDNLYEIYDDAERYGYSYIDYIKYDDMDNSQVVYIKYYLSDQTYEVIRQVKLEDYINSRVYSANIEYTRTGNWIFAFEFSDAYSYNWLEYQFEY